MSKVILVLMGILSIIGNFYFSKLMIKNIITEKFFSKIIHAILLIVVNVLIFLAIREIILTF